MSPRMVIETYTGRTTQQHDAPFQNPPPLDPEVIEVTDPAHPLYGRRFQVLSISHPSQPPGPTTPRPAPPRSCHQPSFPTPRPRHRRLSGLLAPSHPRPGDRSKP